MTAPVTQDDGLLGLGFLAGRWRGEGTLRGRPVTSRTECRPGGEGGGGLSMRVETLRGGAVIHAEDLLWMPAAGALVRCVTRPRADEEQVWRVARTAPDAWELTRPGQRWTIRRDGAAWEEIYGDDDGAGGVTPVVVLRHLRDEDPAP